ncbi:MAG: hypothetical protein ABIN96_01905 [Rubrivivax sp.]
MTTLERLPSLSPISPLPDTNPAFDARALFDEGLAEVRRLSSALWTDHNTHDPGITTLELLCYALTELSYRHSLPIEERLAGDADGSAQFLAPRSALPNRALTELDWRKWLIDLPGVKNAWIEVANDMLLYADLRRKALRQTPPEHPQFKEVPLAGLYRVRVEFMDSVDTQVERNSVLVAVRRALESARNLCEDFIEVRAVRAEYFSVCAELELAPDADVTEVAAQLLFDIGQVLAPPVPSHDLATLIATSGNAGMTLADAFDGPLLEHGFIADADLLASALPAEIHLSDVIGVAMDVPGLRSVRSLTINPLARADEDDENAADADPTAVVADPVPVPNAWRIGVRPGRLPRLSLNQGRLVFSKRGLAVQGWNIADMPGPVAARLAGLREAARLAVETPVSASTGTGTGTGTSTPAQRLGRGRPLATWESVQRDFPALYGIGEAGLSQRATPQRQAQVLQFKGFLLLFDQLMADQLALLSQARLRLSVDPSELQSVAQRFGPGATVAPHVLASQIVDSVVDGVKLYPAGPTPGKLPPDLLQTLQDALETPAAAAARQQRLLDHLLARIAEDFSDYSGAMASAFHTPTSRLIGDKARFLVEAAEVTMNRAGAMHQRPATAAEVWNTDNVSGLERRLAALLGIADFSRRDLGLVSYETYNEIDHVPDSIDEYRFRVRHNVTHHIVLSSSTRYPTPEAARAEMIQAIERGQQPEGYQRLIDGRGRPYFNIIDATGEVLARRIRYFESAEAMEVAIEELMTYLRGHYGGEGLYVVEHLLLRPLAASDTLFTICFDLGCGNGGHDGDSGLDLDPYSYRLQIILPAYAGRFQDHSFRQFVEHTIRREVPAHILPTVCWVSAEHMSLFQAAWRDWLMLAGGFSTTDRAGKLKALLQALMEVKNVYPVRALFDCVGDETKPPFILGRASLGREPPPAA